MEAHSTSDRGLNEVSSQTAAITGQQPVWVRNKEDAEFLQAKVSSLVKGRTISADAAVQVALLNNKRVQVAFADVGLSAADAWQQTMLENPKVSIGLLGIAHPEIGAIRAIEGMIAANILAIATRNSRMELADNRFRQAKLRAVEETLSVAAEARTAWINAVAAFETVHFLNKAQISADASSELALKLGETGAIPKGAQAREHVFFAELSGQRAQARLAARLAKEELTRVMGLWGSDLNYFVPDFLPSLPNYVRQKPSIEAEALRNRVDLKAAKLELDAMAKSYGLTHATRYVTDLEIISGFEAERELEDGEKKWTTTPQVELEFVIPIFDSGQARLRKAELAYKKAALVLAEKAINIRSEARSAQTAYLATYEIARHYRDAVVPLRIQIEEEALLTYNGMISSTFELLADNRAKTNAILQAANSKRDFWLANASLSGAIFGGGAGGAAMSGGTEMVAGGGAEH